MSMLVDHKSGHVGTFPVVVTVRPASVISFDLICTIRRSQSDENFLHHLPIYDVGDMVNIRGKEFVVASVYDNVPVLRAVTKAEKHVADHVSRGVSDTPSAHYNTILLECRPNMSYMFEKSASPGPYYCSTPSGNLAAEARVKAIRQLYTRARSDMKVVVWSVLYHVGYVADRWGDPVTSNDNTELISLLKNDLHLKSLHLEGS